ncbi:hypothetical protein SDC9_189139 [bioreactor metagenome]|uniref:Uncharacterized protein n=1 Tax=bioreactor metagenome TaxID=1076179 RepID=A0A645HRB2_9ZZZZ
MAKRRNREQVQHRDEVAFESGHRLQAPNGRAEKRGKDRREGHRRQRGKHELLRVVRQNDLFANEFEHVRQRLVPRWPFAVLHSRVDLSIHKLQQERKDAQKQQAGEQKNLDKRH